MFHRRATEYAESHVFHLPLRGRQMEIVALIEMRALSS